jgi:hypothetical protein
VGDKLEVYSLITITKQSISRSFLGDFELLVFIDMEGMIIKQTQSQLPLNCGVGGSGRNDYQAKHWSHLPYCLRLAPSILTNTQLFSILRRAVAVMHRSLLLRNLDT